jgi:hypothetical protein
MGNPGKPAFTHRHKRDGPFVSVGRICFQTVETSKCEVLLAASERLHVCKELDARRTEWRKIRHKKRNGS